MIKNVIAKCIDRNSPDDYVDHKVEWDVVENGSSEHKLQIVSATDPLNAIKSVFGTINPQ
jgi:hypothetical protein